MGSNELSRRDFLRTTSVLATTVAGGGTIIFGPDCAWALTLAKLDEPAAATLMQLARDLYPHDAVDDGPYAKVVEKLDQEAVKDPASAQSLSDGIKALNAAAGGKYVVADEAKRTGILKSMEKDAFVQKVRGSMINNFYNDPAVWKKLGYEGSSAEFGGYVNRGFDDIAWLPKS